MSKPPRPSSRIPNSVFFEKIVPVLLIGLGLVMVVLMIVAAGVLIGFIKF